MQNHGYPVPHSGSGLTPDSILVGEISCIILFLATYYTSRECSMGT